MLFRSGVEDLLKVRCRRVLLSSALSSEILGEILIMTRLDLNRHCLPRLAFAICGQLENRIVKYLNKAINE